MGLSSLSPIKSVFFWWDMPYFWTWVWRLGAWAKRKKLYSLLSLGRRSCWKKNLRSQASWLWLTKKRSWTQKIGLQSWLITAAMVFTEHDLFQVGQLVPLGRASRWPNPSLPAAQGGGRPWVCHTHRVSMGAVTCLGYFFGVKKCGKPMNHDQCSRYLMFLSMYRDKKMCHVFHFHTRSKVRTFRPNANIFYNSHCLQKNAHNGARIGTTNKNLRRIWQCRDREGVLLPISVCF